MAINDLKLATTIKMSKDSIKRINSMTFLFDPKHDINQIGYDGETLPFAFFELVSVHEIQHNTVSNRRILLYESDAQAEARSKQNTGSNNKFVSQSVLQVVSDNIVTDPLQWNMEILIPYGFMTKLFSSVGEAISAVTNFFEPKATGTVLSVTSRVAQAMDYTSRLAKTVDFFMGNSSSMYNRNSLMAMARNRSVLKMKSWDSWDYKYVIIKNINITKDGINDDYFNATLEVQEVPILTVAKIDKKVEQTSGDEGLNIPPRKSGIVAGTLIQTFELLTGVYEKIGGGS